MGEAHGRAPDGFDFGNSPFEVSTVDFQGKTIIQRTSAGTQGIVEAATKAERLYAASLVTAEATVRALLSRSPDQFSLVAVGGNGLKRTDEDELWAIHTGCRSKSAEDRSSNCFSSGLSSDNFYALPHSKLTCLGCFRSRSKVAKFG